MFKVTMTASSSVRLGAVTVTTTAADLVGSAELVAMMVVLPSA